MKRRIAHRPAPRQRGFSMIVVLLLLTIMIGLGTTALRTAAADARISGNERDRQLAFEAAEAALRDGESLLAAAPPPADHFDAGCSRGLCLPSATGMPQWRQIDWDGPAAIRYGHGNGEYAQPGVVRAPRYIIELLPPVAAGIPYRITAAGWGLNLASEVRLQSVFLVGNGAAGRRISWRQER
jgi:type IV pilus assembly protein PilX